MPASEDKIALMFPNLILFTRHFTGRIYTVNNQNFRPPAQGVYHQNLAKQKMRDVFKWVIATFGTC